MRIPAVFSVLLLLHGFAFCQTVDVSIPDKLSNKLYDFDIIGKTSEGILIFKFGKSENNIMEAYSDNMSLRWKKPVELKENNATIEKITGVHDGLLVIYTVKTKEEIILYARKLRHNLEFVSEIRIDSIPLKKSKETNGFIVRYSKDKSKFLIYSNQSNGTFVNSITAYAIDENLRLLWSKNMEIDESYLAVKIEKSLIDNSGNAFFVFNNFSNKPRKQNEQPKKFSVLAFDFSAGQVQQYKLLAEGKFVFDSYFEIDNLNKTLNCSGFYSDNSPNSFSGIFYFTADIQKRAIVQQQFKPLPADLLVKMLGKYAPDGKNELSDFEVKNMIMRNDGGAILVAEMFFKTIETRTVPNVYGNYSYIDYDYYHFYDILVLSVNADGTTDWHAVLKKKQVSEEDDGYYSSFALLALRNELHFVFNEDIYRKTNIVDYSVDSNGKQERKTLMNTERKELMLMHRFARQVSANEIIIPSLERNYLKFVKITY